MTHSHQTSLVVLSIVVALVGSYVALDFSKQATVTEEETGRFRWLFGGGAVLGMTVWAMHFTAMLAFNARVPLTWDFVIVFVAAMVAVAGSTAGLIIVGRRRQLARWALLGGSIFVGFAIVGMHFTAMAAMRIEALPVYDVWWVLISAAIAISGSGAGLWLVFRGAAEEETSSVPAELARKVGSTVLQACAIVGMHYAAMEALSLIPIQGAQDASEQPIEPALSNSLLGWSVGGVALFVLILTLLGSSYGRRLNARVAGRDAGRKAQEEGERRFRSLVQNSSEVVKITDTDGTLQYASPAFEKVFGYDPEKAVGTNVLDYVHPEDVPRLLEETERTLENPETNTNTVEYRFRHADGSWRHVESVGTYLLEDPAVEGVVINVRDVTERKEFEERLAFQAFHDPLTELPNRAFLLDRLRQALSRSRRQGSGDVALLFIDLDDFKEINDTLGHEAGDELLVAVAGRLEEIKRPEDTLARLGGDEFCLLLEDLGDPGADSSTDSEKAAQVAERILAELSSSPFVIHHRAYQGRGEGNSPVDQDIDGEDVRYQLLTPIFIVASIGVALSGDFSGGHHYWPVDLLKEADLAVYRSKELGKGRYELFEPSLAHQAEERMRIKSDLVSALDRGEFELYYQPKVCLRTGEILWMEGLLRWNHPERGLLMPNEFISVAEDSGLIVPIGRWVIQEALSQGRRWREQGGAGGVEPVMTRDQPSGATGRASVPAVCVNLSAKQLAREGIVREVSDLLEATRTDAGRFGIEVTESVLVEDESSLTTLEEFWSMGVSISIDDFGTGYSSLAYLQRFPAHILKLDCSFIKRLEEHSRDAVIVSGMINLAHATGKKVVAECVENAHQLALLKEMGCEMGQGNLFSEPLPTEEIARLVAGYSPSGFLGQAG